MELKSNESQVNPVLILIPYFFTIDYNDVFSSIPRSFRQPIPVAVSILSFHAFLSPFITAICPSHLSFLNLIFMNSTLLNN